MTYASTFYAVLNAGLKPVLVDINDNEANGNYLYGKYPCVHLYTKL